MNDTASLLNDTIATLDRYVVLADDAHGIALALWTIHTWAFDGAHATPYISITSPEKRTGKTRLLEVLELLVREPFRVSSASPAAIYRTIEHDRPTLMIDEVDAIFATAASDRNEALRSLLNSGVRAGAWVSVCVGQGHDVKRFSTFCPKVLAGIDNGRLPETIRDRAIEIKMHRRISVEPVARFRHRTAHEQTNAHREAARIWGEIHGGGLHDVEPDMPDELNDRMQDAWEPLLAIADLAGGDWPRRARCAAVRLSGGEDTDEASNGTRLLAACHAIFGVSATMFTAEMLQAINRDEDLPFGGWHEGRGMDSRDLARMLKPYGITPRTVRTRGRATLKGYRRDEFSSAWARYVLAATPAPEPAESSPSVDDDGRVTDVTDVTDHRPPAVPDATDAEQSAYERALMLVTDVDFEHATRARVER